MISGNTAQPASPPPAPPRAAAVRLGQAPASRPWLSALLLPALAIAAYLPGLGNGFVHWDDVRYIRDNPHLVRDDGLGRIWTTFESPQYYPLTFTSYWIEYQLWGPRPAGYFLTNVLLHALNTLLVYQLVRELGAARAVAWLTAALFALHPLQVASVAWLAQRKNVLSGAFSLATLILFLRYRRRGEAALYAGCLVAFLLALLSKTAVVTLPLLLLLTELLVFRQRGARALVRVTPFLALSLLLGIVTIIAEHRLAPTATTAAPQPLAAAAALWMYLFKLIWPATLLALYPMWHVTLSIGWLSPPVALLAAGAAVWHWRARLGDLTLWGLGCFVLLLLPAIGLVPFGYLLNSPIGDHFVYLASIGLFLPVALLAGRLAGGAFRTPRGVLVVVAAGVVLAAAGLRTAVQVRVWHDGETLWAHTLAYNTSSALAWNNLGVAQANAGKFDAALGSFQQAARLDPEFWMAHINVGRALAELGQQDAALAEFRLAVERDPANAVAHFNLANALVAAQDLPGALAAYAEATRRDPQYAEAFSRWGTALLAAGDNDAAIRALETAVRLNPADPVSRFNLAIALANRGALDRAEAQYLEVLRLSPESSQAYTNLGLLMVAQGRLSEAVRFLKSALALNPDDGPAHLNLGTLAVHAGRPQDAEEHFRAALRLAPDDAEAHSNLGMLLVRQRRYEEGIPLLTAVLERRPDHANTHYMLGVALAATQQLDAAIEHLRRAVELAPDDREAQEALAAAELAPTTTTAPSRK